MIQTFAHKLKWWFEEKPNQKAITFVYRKNPQHVVDYHTLFRGAGAYAKALEAAHIQPHEVVIIILQHSEALVYAFWGCVLRGAIPSIMPFLTEKLSPQYYRHSIQTLLEITKPAAIITSTEFLGEVRQALKADCSVRVVLEADPIESLTNDELDDVISKGTAVLRGLAAEAQDIVLLQHSSGTTGLQKGVALSHQAVFRQLDNYAQAIHLDEGDTIVSWLPLYHDMGLIAGFIMPLLCGVPLVLMSPFEWVRAPQLLLQAISEHRGTLTWLPNFAYHFCSQKIRDADLEGVNLASLRAVINCSEPMYKYSHDLFLERFRPYGFREEALATCYAMAENVFAVTQGGIDEKVRIDCISRRAFTEQHIAKVAQEGEEAMYMVSAGKPIPNVEVKVLDQQSRAALPQRQVGEIALRSNCMLSGYYNRPDVTAEAFHDGWFLTGDLGYMAEGEVFITGRKKDLIIVGGKNVYSRDLENIVNEVAGVHPGRTAAFGVPNVQSGTEDVAIVAETDEESPERREEIAEAVREAIAKNSDVVARYVRIVERGWLVKTSSGKVSRSANREKFLAELQGE